MLITPCLGPLCRLGRVGGWEAQGQASSSASPEESSAPQEVLYTLSLPGIGPWSGPPPAGNRPTLRHRLTRLQQPLKVDQQPRSADAGWVTPTGQLVQNLWEVGTWIKLAISPVRANKCLHAQQAQWPPSQIRLSQALSLLGLEAPPLSSKGSSPSSTGLGLSY